MCCKIFSRAFFLWLLFHPEEVNELEGRLDASRQRVREVEARLVEVTGDKNNTNALLDTQVKELEATKTTNLKTR